MNNELREVLAGERQWCVLTGDAEVARREIAEAEALVREQKKQQTLKI